MADAFFCCGALPGDAVISSRAIIARAIGYCYNCNRVVL